MREATSLALVATGVLGAADLRARVLARGRTFDPASGAVNRAPAPGAERRVMALRTTVRRMLRDKQRCRMRAARKSFPHRALIPALRWPENGHVRGHGNSVFTLRK